MSGVRIEQRDGLGNVLLATRSFDPGETVVHERPLLHVPQLKPSNPLYKALQEYFQQHHIPPSVVLKVMAFVTASPVTQDSVLTCFCPDPTAHKDAAVVQQARAFAACLLQHPPAPEFAKWAEQTQSAAHEASSLQTPPAAGQTAAPAAGAAPAEGPAAEELQVQQQQPKAFDLLVRVWLIWVMNGHSFRLGSALFNYGSKLTHTCGLSNTMYRTAKGDIASVVESVDGSSGSSSAEGSSLQQQPPAAAGGGDANAAGAHLALACIAAGDLLTTNYLGMGHKRLMSTPARQKYLQDKFLFTCTCRRCVQEVDVARGIPCPSCSGTFRSEDKLLKEQEALPDWHVGDSLTSTSSSSVSVSTSGNASSSGSGGGGGGSGDSSRCGYIYCDMAAQLAGADAPWKCDVCGATVANDTAELWGRFYAKSHSSIELDMEGWVARLDASMDSAPLVRDPAVLHQRVVSMVRLLGPRHWASWRLLLLGVELHCGALEEASLRAQLQQRQADRAAQQAAAAPKADPAPTSTASPAPMQHAAAAAEATTSSGTAGEGAADASAGVARDPAAAASFTQLAVWVVRYCRQLWAAVGGKYGEVEAGQALGHHFSEVCQVLLQVSSHPGLLPQATANGLVDAALQLQLLVLPGLRSIMGPAYNPLEGLVGDASLSGLSGAGGLGTDAAAVTAAVRRQQQQRAAEAAQMMSLVRELKQLEARERS